MKTKLTTTATERRRAALRSVLTVDTAKIQADAEAGLIQGVAIMTIGPAAGHGFWIDRQTLEQCRDLINAKPKGAIVRFRHPELKEVDGQYFMPETLGEDVGYVLPTTRLDGDTLRGDVQLGTYAKSLPKLGNVWDYLLAKAKEDPAGMGMSAVIGWDGEEHKDDDGAIRILARVNEVDAVDFVGTPAANPNGLLAAKPEMEPKMKSLKELCDACMAACRACVADCRACIDACSSLSGSADSVAAVIAACMACVARCQECIAACRTLIDQCNAMPAEPVDDATAAACSACIRICQLCIKTCNACIDACYPMRWGTSELAKACDRCIRLCQTCIAECFQCQDACRPMTATIAAMAARKRAAGDVKLAALTKKK
jgi:hypothetical protein